MNDQYSPHTFEHVSESIIADWLLHAGVECPEYDPKVFSAFWVNNAWELRPAVVEKIVPASVSRAQGKIALINAGLWDSVLAAVEGIADPAQKALAEISLNETTMWERSSPFLSSLAGTLGLSADDLDNLFIAASEIQI